MVALLLLAGVGIILQNEAAYRDLQEQETRVQADILAASVAAALDFGDRQAAQEAVDTIRVNRQIRAIGVYRDNGALIAGYGRDGAAPPPRYADPPPAAGNAITAIAPVISRGERIGTVYLAADPEPLSRRLTRYLVIGLLVVMAALVVIVLGIAQNALRRVNLELAERAGALVRANAELKVQVGERTKAEDQLRQAHKMQALGQLTGGIAHDFNNLLTVIQGSADMLRRPALADDKRLRFADAVVQAAARAAALTGQLLAFARRQPLRPEIIEVNELIRDMTDLLDRTLGERIEVKTDPLGRRLRGRGRPRPARIGPAQHRRQRPRRDARRRPADDPHRRCVDEARAGRMIALSVSDSGVGMDEDTLAAPSSRSSPPRRPARAPASASARSTASPASRAARSISTAPPAKERP